MGLELLVAESVHAQLMVTFLILYIRQYPCIDSILAHLAVPFIILLI